MAPLLLQLKIIFTEGGVTTYNKTIGHLGESPLHFGHGDPTDHVLVLVIVVVVFFG